MFFDYFHLKLINIINLVQTVKRINTKFKEEKSNCFINFIEHFLDLRKKIVLLLGN